MNKAFPTHLSTVQALRGVAAMLVLFLHVAGMQREIIGAPDGLANGFWDRGFAGVDIFFVISGFIMVYVTRDVAQGAGSAWTFFKARVIRIYPLWWFYAALMALIFFVIFGAPARPEIAAKAGGAWPYLAKSFALWPQSQNPVLTVGWTLTFEMYYYVIFAFILLLPRRFLPWALMLWAVQIFVTQLVPNAAGVVALIRSPLSLEFIGGAVMAMLILSRKIFFPKLWLILGTFAFAAGMMFLSVGSEFGDGWGRALAFGLPSLAIIYGLVALELDSNIRAPKWAQALGDWSYSLYLGHLIVLLVMKNIWEVLTQIGLPEGLQLGAAGPWDNLAFAIASICMAILAAMLSYRLIERPITRILRRYLLDRRVADS